MKRILTLLLCAVLTLSLAVPALAVQTEQETTAAWLKENGILTGDQNGNLNLSSGLTRAELAVILTRLSDNTGDMDRNAAYYRTICLNSIRGFNMSCQIVVQSLSQWQEKYPGKEWENQLATFDQTLYMGCNDMTSAEYISKKCGKVTISVTNNQMPLMPLFSPVYTSTRPYSQTRSNTQRDLMLPDEILRLDRRQCIALFQGHKPALLYKLAPEELPDYNDLKSCRVVEYVPEWKRREDEQKDSANKTPPPPAPESPREEPPPAQKDGQSSPESGVLPLSPAAGLG